MSPTNERSCDTFSGPGPLTTASIFSCVLWRPLSISCPQNWTLSLKNSHFSLLAFRPVSCSRLTTLYMFSKCSSSVLPETIMSSRIHWVPGIPCNTWSKARCQIAGHEEIPKTKWCIGRGPCKYWSWGISWNPLSLPSGDKLGAGQVCQNAYPQPSSLKYPLWAAEDTVLQEVPDWLRP